MFCLRITNDKSGGVEILYMDFTAVYAIAYVILDFYIMLGVYSRVFSNLGTFWSIVEIMKLNEA